MNPLSRSVQILAFVLAVAMGLGRAYWAMAAGEKGKEGKVVAQVIE